MDNLTFLKDFMVKTDHRKADIARRVGVTNAVASYWSKHDDMRLSTSLIILSRYNCDIKPTFYKVEESMLANEGHLLTICKASYASTIQNESDFRPCLNSLRVM